MNVKCTPGTFPGKIVYVKMFIVKKSSNMIYDLIYIDVFRST